MAQPCAAILIDPVARTVTEVQWNGDYRHIYELIDCDCYDVARINKHGDGIFVDDEGLMKDGMDFFIFDGYPSPLAGKGLILGCDSSGESIKPHVTLADAKAAVRFVQPVSINGHVRWLAYDHAEE